MGCWDEFGYSFGNIEGNAKDVVDINIPFTTFGVSYGTGDDGKEYASVTVGAGAGGMVGQTQTTTRPFDKE